MVKDFLWSVIGAASFENPRLWVTLLLSPLRSALFETVFMGIIKESVTCHRERQYRKRIELPSRGMIFA